MADQTNQSVSRREFLKLGVSVTAGVIVPPMLAACTGDSTWDPPKETFVEPLELRSVNGVLDVTLVLSYLTTTLPNPATGVSQSVTLRNMYGTIPAPTLRMRVGDLLRIRVINNLPANPTYPPVNPVPPATLPWPQPAHLRYPNSTNLHTHGLHVYPDVYPEPFTPPGTSWSTTRSRASSRARRGSTNTASARITLRARTGTTRTFTDRPRCRSAAAWRAR
jgi:FtsP/CotA-like multicopper oxidase with cupredoxin domain